MEEREMRRDTVELVKRRWEEAKAYVLVNNRSEEMPLTIQALRRVHGARARY